MRLFSRLSLGITSYIYARIFSASAGIAASASTRIRFWFPPGPGGLEGIPPGFLLVSGDPGGPLPFSPPVARVWRSGLLTRLSNGVQAKQEEASAYYWRQKKSKDGGILGQQHHYSCARKRPLPHPVSGTSGISGLSSGNTWVPETGLPGMMSADHSKIWKI